MSNYRLHIDIPLEFEEDKAIEITNRLMNKINDYFEIVTEKRRVPLHDESYIGVINYRLGHDDDRQKSNYMMKNDEGHTNNKKCRLTFNVNSV